MVTNGFFMCITCMILETSASSTFAPRSRPWKSRNKYSPMMCAWFNLVDQYSIFFEYWSKSPHFDPNSTLHLLWKFNVLRQNMNITAKKAGKIRRTTAITSRKLEWKPKVVFKNADMLWLAVPPVGVLTCMNVVLRSAYWDVMRPFKVHAVGHSQ